LPDQAVLPLCACLDALSAADRERALNATLPLFLTALRSISLGPRLDVENQVHDATIDRLVEAGRVALPGLLTLLHGNGDYSHPYRGDALTSSIPDFVERFGDTTLRAGEYSENQHKAAEVLGRFGPNVLPDLVQVLRGDPGPARLAVGHALRVMSKRFPIAIFRDGSYLDLSNNAGPLAIPSAPAT
jgi:hypothetical protein